MMANNSFKDELDKFAKSYIALFHKYRLYPQSTDDYFHFFFEGEEDRDFYIPSIKRNKPHLTPLPYKGDGKHSVIQLYKLIKKQWRSPKNTAFFIDKDFDDLLKIKTPRSKFIFKTSYYSIENYLNSDNALTVLLIERLGLHINDESSNVIRKNLQIHKTIFLKQIINLTAFVLCLKELNIQIDQNKIRLNLLCEIIDNNPISKKKAALSILLESTDIDISKITTKQFRTWHTKLKSYADKKWIRGKFDIWLLERSLMHSLHSLGISKKKLQSCQLIEYLSPRIEPIPEIELFIQSL